MKIEHSAHSREECMSMRRKEGTVKYRFNESRFNAKSRFKVQSLVTEMKFHVKKSRFSVMSRFKE